MKTSIPHVHDHAIRNIKPVVESCQPSQHNDPTKHFFYPNTDKLASSYDTVGVVRTVEISVSILHVSI
jgi:hypothetical protein